MKLPFCRSLLFCDPCKGKATVAYTKPQQRKKEESERLTREGDKIKFINLRFEGGQVVGFGTGRRGLNFPEIASSWDE